MDNEDFDLYGDLDEALIEPLQEEVQKKQAEELEKQKIYENYREETEKIINELKTSNFQLKKNMSLLLATAKSEIERKDQQIKDLRREMDEILFRKNKGSKKTCDKWAQTDKVEFNDNRSSSSRYSESNKLHDRHRAKEPVDSDRHKRRLSSDKRYSDDYRKTSQREENGSKNRSNEAKNRKLSHKSRSRSPDRHEKKIKHELREDDFRKTLLKNKNDDKTGSSNKESNKKADDKRDSSSREKKDKYKEKERIKEKNGSKIEKTDEKRDKRKVVKDKVSDPASNDTILNSETTKSSIVSIKNEAAAENPKDVQKAKSSIDSIKKEISVEIPKDVSRTEIMVEEKVPDPKTVKEETQQPKTTEIPYPVTDTSSVPVKNEIQEMAVDQTAQSDIKLEYVEVMSSNLNLSAESDSDKVPVPSGKVTDKDVKEEKVEMIEKHEMPENPKNCKTKDEQDQVKTFDPAPKKQKYVPIFEAKIFPSAKDIKNDVIKSERFPSPKQEDDLSKCAQKFHPINKLPSKELLPITVTIEKRPEKVLEREQTFITEVVATPITTVMQEIKDEAVDIPDSNKEISSAPESLNDSFESTKENSLNNSFEKRKHKKRKITTEVEADGTVVWTVTRKKRKTKE